MKTSKFKYLLSSSLLFFVALSGCSSKNSTVQDQTTSTVRETNTTSSDETKSPSPELPKKSREPIEFLKIGVIREFGGTDTAAMFGVLLKAGKLEITKVEGPSFIHNYQVGELNQKSMGHIFLNSTQPLSTEERAKLVGDFNGATILYTEGYSGSLCRDDEVGYTIKATGKIDETEIELLFQFEAFPSAHGNCKFHLFGVVANYIN